MKNFIFLISLFLVSFASKAQCYIQIESGDNYMVAIKQDGTLWSWGRNNNGQLGDGTTTDRNIPTQIGTNSDWNSISTGTNHTIAIRNNGSIWGWGGNGNYKIGIITTSFVLIPTQIGTATNWNYVSAGDKHTMAIKTDGTLWAWGRNFEGQLGIGTTVGQIQIPTQVGTATNWNVVAAGLKNSFATRSGNTLWGWGSGGAVGDGTNIDRLSPVQIGTGTNWIMPYANVSAMARKSDGTLWAWGNNGYGQLGIGSNSDQLSPVQMGTANNWRSVSMGFGHTLAVNTFNSLYAWGWNVSGQLGNGTTVNTNIPTLLSQNVLKIAAGDFQNMATLSTTQVYTWGSNQYGQIGNGTISTNGQPVAPTSINCIASLANESFETKTISLYPNPSNGVFTISLSENYSKVIAYDILGKEVEVKAMNNNQFSIENKGIYFLKIISENGKITNHKLIIE